MIVINIRKLINDFFYSVFDGSDVLFLLESEKSGPTEQEGTGKSFVYSCSITSLNASAAFACRYCLHRSKCSNIFDVFTS